MVVKHGEVQIHPSVIAANVSFVDSASAQNVGIPQLQPLSGLHTNFCPFLGTILISLEVFLQWTPNDPKMQEYQTLAHLWTPRDPKMQKYQTLSHQCTPHMTLECRNTKLSLFSEYIVSTLKDSGNQVAKLQIAIHLSHTNRNILLDSGKLK